MSDGTRKVTSISEITGMEENVISMQEIFTFNKKGSGPTARSLAHSSRPASVPSSSNGCASRASSCRPACSSAKRWSTKKQERRSTVMGLIHCLVFRRVYSRSSLCC
jgi:hypothetical protein